MERVSRWSPEMQMLAVLADRLGDLVNAIYLTSGGQKIVIPRIERPVSQLQILRERNLAQRSRDFIARMVPAENPPTN